MYFRILIGIVAVACIRVRPTDGANILAFFPLPVYSHFSGFNPLFMELANRGHRVTVVTPFYPKGNVPSGYVHVPVPDVKIKRTATNPMDIRNAYRVQNMVNVKTNMINMVRRTLVLKETQAFLNDTGRAFDLVLVECWYSDAYLAVGHRYGAPTVCLSPMLPSVTLCSSLAVPNNPSYVPSFWLHYPDVMSFTERLYNAAVVAAETALLSGVAGRRDEEQEMMDAAYTYPGHENTPPLDALRAALTLSLINSHYSVSYARPYPPNVVPVAGMHMMGPRSAADVDRKLKKLLDGATDGVIYFSFGSNIKMANLPAREVRTFVESFRKLRQTVLWKWENGTIDDLPGNVYVDKWFPQQYVLGHKNCKLFITHGGYHSLVEALHYGLPVIGFPFYTDQYYNMRFVAEKGFGIQILLNDLRENVLDGAIRDVLHDPSYKENAATASEIFTDAPTSALDTAVYWTEYALRNGRGDRGFLRPYDLIWYQYYGLDVVGFVAVVSACAALAVRKSVKRLRQLSGGANGTPD
ncbi:UDP-glucuronosyl/UDP-glucosyltransferase [Cinara cedri]|uniref:UDP-glucuronosyltransferase n=1 Tax=Cinara cedri TaxID=506608 RepID=A0A5E4N4X2_9HEMI|nr:UDP-glucuronosyl/UDP-glucosyltransferase [Cinara cedri]